MQVTGTNASSTRKMYMYLLYVKPLEEKLGAETVELSTQARLHLELVHTTIQDKEIVWIYMPKYNITSKRSIIMIFHPSMLLLVCLYFTSSIWTGKSAFSVLPAPWVTVLALHHDGYATE